MEGNTCINCGASLSESQSLSNEQEVPPIAGDVTVCAYCGEIMEFSDDMALIAVSPEALSALSDEAVAALKAVKTFIAVRAKTFNSLFNV